MLVWQEGRNMSSVHTRVKDDLRVQIEKGIRPTLLKKTNNWAVYFLLDHAYL